MIGVEEAKKLIRENITPLRPVLKPLEQVSGHILAADVFSAYDIPAFRQSSMDGYAVIYGDTNVELEVIGEMAAGTAGQHKLKPGQAMRIFTGAAVPEGADTVVMQEKVLRIENRISVTDGNLNVGANVREPGAEIRRGDLAMQKGDLLRPAAVAFLAGIGVHELQVYPMPRVAIILTGNELQKPGLPLSFGQVYESNSYSLLAALRNEGITDVEVVKAEDTLEQLSGILKEALTENDLVVLTGGVSVGNYDFVPAAAANCGVQQIFHKIKQKPGKPLFFGKHNDKVIFGLPGNPSSVLSCYYNYVLPAICALSKKENRLVEFDAELAHEYSKPITMTHFLKGNYDRGKAMLLGAQESFRLSSFARANCLIRLDEGQEHFPAGAIVRVILI